MKVRPGRFIVVAAILTLLAFGFYSAGNVIFAEKPNFTSASGYEESNDEEEVEAAEEETQGEVLTDEEENTASVSGYEAESDTVAAAVLGTVDRQDVTPGTQQTGNTNISGTGLFGKVGVSGDSGTSGLTGVDMEHTGTNPRKWRVGAQGSQLKGSFAITDITTSEANPKYRLTINKFGKVGIGTKRPKEKLHVNGNVKANNFIGNGSGLTGVITTETDPIFGGSPAAGITAPQIANWNTAYSWGDHTIPGYLTGYTETDPVFGGSPAFGITAPQISNWNTAYSWGNHAVAGYLTGYAETDPQVGANTLNYVPKWDGTALVTGSIFDNGTDVGIGTVPSYKLDVITGESGTAVRIENDNNGTGTTYGIYVEGDALGTGTSWGYGGYFTGRGGSTSGGAYGTENYAYAYGSNPAYGVYSNATGGTTTGREYAFYGIGDSYFSQDVGIGTVPSYKLDVRTGEQGPAVRILNDNNGSGSTYGIQAIGDARDTGSGWGYGGYFYGRGGSTSGGAYGTEHYAYANGNSPAYGVWSNATEGTTSGREYAFYGLGDGYFSQDVGIGDTTPDGKLEVRQTGTDDIFNLYDSATNVLTVRDGGNVGIGTSNPAAKLDINDLTYIGSSNSGPVIIGSASGAHVTLDSNELQAKSGASGESTLFLNYWGGDIHLGYGADGAAQVKSRNIYNRATFSGSRYYVMIDSSGYTLNRNTSSARYKEDIKPLKDDFNKILKSRPKSFKLKDSDAHEIGYIAEDFDRAGLNNLVTYDEQGRPDAIRYELISLYLLEVIKELKAENVAMKQEVKEKTASLEQEVNDINAVNKAIRRDNIALKAENEQLKENLLAMGSRLEALETMMLALSTNPKEKLAKLELINSDGVQKAIQ